MFLACSTDLLSINRVNFGVRVKGAGCSVQSIECRVWVGFRVEGVVFQGFRVSEFQSFRVSGFKGSRV
jgi:hypothetical protein